MKTKNRRTKYRGLLIGLGIFLFSLIFISASVFFKIFEFEILPSQFFGALIGVVITAIITVLLLQGQTTIEEKKEKNVKVFEEKTNRYNAFIEELWKIWEDRKISLDELNKIMKMFCKDIILFTSTENAKLIIGYLNQIAESSELNELDESNTNKNQYSIEDIIYEIVNILSNELDLGGNFDDNAKKDLRKLSEKIDELRDKQNKKEIEKLKTEEENKKIEEEKELNKKVIEEYKEKFFNEINSVFSNSGIDFDKVLIDKWSGGGENSVYLWAEIKDSPFWLVMGPFLKDPESGRDSFISLYSYFWDHRYLDKYRLRSKGIWKDLLYGKKQTKIINFNDFSSIKEYIESCNNGDSLAIKLANESVDFVKNWGFDGKSIFDIINEHKQA